MVSNGENTASSAIQTALPMATKTEYIVGKNSARTDSRRLARLAGLQQRQGSLLGQALVVVVVQLQRAQEQ
jgi:hypothetical protein